MPTFNQIMAWNTGDLTYAAGRLQAVASSMRSGTAGLTSVIGHSYVGAAADAFIASLGGVNQMANAMAMACQVAAGVLQEAAGSIEAAQDTMKASSRGILNFSEFGMALGPDGTLVSPMGFNRINDGTPEAARFDSALMAAKGLAARATSAMAQAVAADQRAGSVLAGKFTPGPVISADDAVVRVGSLGMALQSADASAQQSVTNVAMAQTAATYGIALPGAGTGFAPTPSGIAESGDGSFGPSIFGVNTATNPELLDAHGKRFDPDAIGKTGADAYEKNYDNGGNPTHHGSSAAGEKSGKDEFDRLVEAGANQHSPHIDAPTPDGRQLVDRGNQSAPAYIGVNSQDDQIRNLGIGAAVAAGVTPSSVLPGAGTSSPAGGSHGAAPANPSATPPFTTGLPKQVVSAPPNSDAAPTPSHAFTSPPSSGHGGTHHGSGHGVASGHASSGGQGVSVGSGHVGTTPTVPAAPAPAPVPAPVPTPAPAPVASDTPTTSNAPIIDRGVRAVADPAPIVVHPIAPADSSYQPPTDGIGITHPIAPADSSYQPPADGTGITHPVAPADSSYQPPTDGAALPSTGLEDQPRIIDTTHRVVDVPSATVSNLGDVATGGSGSQLVIGVHSVEPNADGNWSFTHVTDQQGQLYDVAYTSGDAFRADYPDGAYVTLTPDVLNQISTSDLGVMVNPGHADAALVSPQTIDNLAAQASDNAADSESETTPIDYD